MTDKSDDLWYIGVDDSVEGPLDRDELERRIRNEELTRDTLVWSPPLDNWAHLSDVDEFNQLIAEVPPPLPDSGASSPILVAADKWEAPQPSSTSTISANSDEQPPMEKGPPPVPDSSTNSSRETWSQEPHPWRRFWARYVDVSLWALPAALLAGVVLAVVWPSAYEALTGPEVSDYWWSMIILAAWIPLESFLLARYGTTPGKWLLSMEVVSTKSSSLGFQRMMSRSVGVWFKGLGMGIPLVLLVTQIVAYNKLKKNGITTWDRRLGFQVRSRKLRTSRVIVAVLVILGFLCLTVLLEAGNTAV